MSGWKPTEVWGKEYTRRGLDVTYLEKPFTTQQLYAELSNWISITTISRVLNWAGALTIVAPTYTDGSGPGHGQAVMQNKNKVVCVTRFGGDPT
jgi:hypothetical protein